MRPNHVVSELLKNLRNHLSRDFRATASRIYAFADFSANREEGPDIKRTLYLQGVEAAFVPSSLQRNAAEVQLAMEVVEQILTSPDLKMVVIVTGDRPYLPVIRYAYRGGVNPLIVMLHPVEGPEVPEDVIFDAIDLLPETTGNVLGARTQFEDEEMPPIAASFIPSEPTPARRAPVEYQEIEDSSTLKALDVIEEHFGHYDEIYLTPLLRKLSEEVGDPNHDPKSIISVLEDAGAVWLEKRKGYPYDYTVLIMDQEHPNVGEGLAPYEESEEEIDLPSDDYYPSTSDNDYHVYHSHDYDVHDD